MSVHRMKKGDRRPFYENYLSVGGARIDLTGATITIHVTDSSGVLHGSFVATPDADQVGNIGLYSYEWQEGDMDVAGRFRAVTHVLFPDGTDQSFPTVGFDTIVVGGNLV